MPSIYVHIPFCKQKCIYCNFYSIPIDNSVETRNQLITKFLFALETEIHLRAEDIRFKEQIDTIYLGGGTPSILQPNEINRILECITSHFLIRDGAEITLETNPGTADKTKFKNFLTIGINRLSIGVQSFNDEDLIFLSRIHTASEAKKSIKEAFEAGFENISIDLIYSLPNQSIDSWKCNLKQTVQFNPTHISCYSLTIEPETQLFNIVQANNVKSPNDDYDAEIYEYTIDYLLSHEYQQYEISNFAKPDFQCKHNLNYWNHTNYIGFGPSAHSFWKNKRWWNTSNITTYFEKLEKHILPISGGEHLTKQQLMEESIYLGLRSTGINFEQFYNRFRIDFLSKYESIISDLIQQGKAKIYNGNFCLTPKGYIICDEICQLFYKE